MTATFCKNSIEVFDFQKFLESDVNKTEGEFLPRSRGDVRGPWGYWPIGILGPMGILAHWNIRAHRDIRAYEGPMRGP